MPRLANYRKPVDQQFDRSDPPSAATPRRGPPPLEVPAEALERIQVLREAGSGFEAIRSALDAEFGLKLPLSVLHSVWENQIEPETPDGEFIQKMRRLVGLPAARWRKYLRDQRRLAAASAATPEDSQSASTRNPPQLQGQ